jgi:hypothetical protein
LAQPPDTSETFLREVDENLRRDQVRDFFVAYGSWLIAGVVLFLAASGGLIWWNQHKAQRSEAEVEQLSQAYQEIGAGNMSRAPQQLDALSDSSSKAVRASAQFARAAVTLQQGNLKAAAAAYQSIAADDSLPAPYRNAAIIRQTALEFDQLQPQQVIARLEPLSKRGEPWFGSAGEMTGLAMLKQGRRQEAASLFAAIGKDSSVPDSIRARASDLAGSLGIQSGGAASVPAQ